MQTLSPPPVRGWEIHRERRVLEKNPRLASALRRWHEYLARVRWAPKEGFWGRQITGSMHFLRHDLVEEISRDLWMESQCNVREGP